MAGQYSAGGQTGGDFTLGFGAALKEIYLPRVVSTINESRILSKRLERDSSKTDISGRFARLPVNIRGSEAIGARIDADGGPALPTPQKQTFVELRIGYALNYATVRITHPTIEASKNNKGAFIQVIGAEMDGIRRDLRNDFNRQWFGDGSGALAKINDSTPTGSATVTVYEGHYLKPGMIVNSFTAKSGGTQDGGDMTVDSTTATTVTFTATPSPDDLANGNFFFREDSRGYEMMGLSGIVDDGTNVPTFQNISRTTYPEWNSTVTDQAGVITEDGLDSILLDAQAQKEAEISLGITDPFTFRKIGQLLTPDRRYGTGMTLEGGFDAIKWNGVPIVWDKDCPRDAGNDHQIFFLDESHLTIYELAPLSFDDTDGNVLHRRQDVAAYDATLFYYAQLGTTDPSKHAKLEGITG